MIQGFNQESTEYDTWLIMVVMILPMAPLPCYYIQLIVERS